MRTPPPDLAPELLAAELGRAWGLPVEDLIYQPVGFGSHHWLVCGRDGERWFATVDDLTAKLRGGDDTEARAFARLASAFGAAYELHHQSKLDFVVAPLPAVGEFLVRRVSHRYALVVHPYVDGEAPAVADEYGTAEDRAEALRLVRRLHAATVPGTARHDDFEIPGRHALEVLLSTSARWSSGPYADPARSLLDKSALDVRVLLHAYDALVSRVSGGLDRMVLTHGEPGAHNMLRTANGFVLVDWESALIAPPERDLWVVAEEDPEMVARSAAQSGTQLDRNALDLYRLWYDLSEIGGYLRLFAEPHLDTADTAESWRNLQFFLRPRERWPALFG